MPSGMELGIIVIVILLLFGGKKIPELAKGIGSGIKNFKNALKEEDEVSIAKSENNINNEVKLSNEKIS
jgi:sec-independent protein translocase protein TatA